MIDEHVRIATETAAPVQPHDDPDCSYTAMPQGMQTFAMPDLDPWRDNSLGADLLAVLETGLQACLRGEVPEIVDLTACDEATRGFADGVLGEGEVSILVEAAPSRVVIRESVVPGIWRIKHFQAGTLAQEYLETGAVPRILHACLTGMPGTRAAEEPAQYPQGLMNAPPLVHEVFAKAAAFSAGQEETLNLTLLPLTPEDLSFLVSTLGLAGVSVLSRGYGDCRISLTQLPNVWWVQYFNSTDQLILNTLEITAMPAVVKAAREDLEDAAVRIGEMRVALLAEA